MNVDCIKLAYSTKFTNGGDIRMRGPWTTMLENRCFYIYRVNMQDTMNRYQMATESIWVFRALHSYAFQCLPTKIFSIGRPSRRKASCNTYRTHWCALFWPLAFVSNREFCSLSLFVFQSFHPQLFEGHSNSPLVPSSLPFALGGCPSFFLLPRVLSHL